MSSPDDLRYGLDQGRQEDGVQQFTNAAEYAAFIRDALDRYGEPLLAFLILDGVDQRNRTLVQRFEDCYAGWYPTRQALMDAQLENLGWPDALTRFRAEHGLPVGVLDFDWAEIWAHCLDVYDVEERLGGVHAFLR